MDSEFLLTSGGTALISSLLMQWMKGSRHFPFLGCTKEFEKVNLIFSVLIAFITSLGVGYKYDEAAGTLVITGLTIAGLAHGAWHWFIQWIEQHISYKTFVVPSEMQAKILHLLQLLIEQQAEAKK